MHVSQCVGAWSQLKAPVKAASALNILAISSAFSHLNFFFFEIGSQFVQAALDSVCS